MGSESNDVIGALDIGTNSFHLVVAKPVETGFEVIASEKEVVRLGHGAGDMKQLEPDAIERGIASLKRMNAIAEVHGAKLRAVATSAVREAKNRNEFIKRARKEAGIEVEVISGVEEARLIHLGAKYAVAVGEQPMLLCDIGGGSTEVVVGSGDEILLSRSDLLADIPTVKDRAKIFNLDSSRSEIILAGAIILEGIALSFGVDKFIYSDYALREGVLFDTLARENLINHPEDVDPALLSVKQLADRCDDRPEHSSHVSKIALSLFDCLQKKLGLPQTSRRYLEAAALLANVGVVVSHSKHHLHSYYVIRNSELVGLTDREIELIAVIARYHRKSAPKLSHSEFAQLEETDQKLVTSLAAILRIAIGLDRTQDGRVKSVTVRAEDEQFL
ncbi:MAG: Ppx/GppA family phosphatase, partial [Acidimicrobiia bacterium]|nr:Ppx/GppA family phosphatase [Acidimicrobiia bacterium]